MKTAGKAYPMKGIFLLGWCLTVVVAQEITSEILINDVYDRNIFVQGEAFGDIIGQNPDHNFYGSWGVKTEAHLIKLVTVQGRTWFGLTDSLSGSFTGYEGGVAFHIKDKAVNDVEQLFLDHVGDQVLYIDVPVKKRKILAVRGGVYSLSAGNYYAGTFDGDSLP